MTTFGGDFAGRLRRGFGPWGLAGAGYLALTLVLMRPLLGGLSHLLPHDLGDPVLSTWILWWNAHHLPFTATWWDGLSFFPEHGSLAFSDHRVGLALIAAPVQWLGGTPVLAHNVTLLLSFPLSALAAHALTWTLTRRHAAGAVSGLVFGFNPYRIAHLQHLELLAAYWLPLVFLGLHLYVERGQTRWLILFAAAWLLEGLSCGYYLFYSMPLIALWMIWFARQASRYRWLAIGAASAAAIGILIPVLLQYRQIHDRIGLVRHAYEVDALSADALGLISASPLLALWHAPALPGHPEGQLFPGVVAIALVITALVQRRRVAGHVSSPHVYWARLTLAVLVLVFAIIALSAAVAPWSIGLPGLTVSANQLQKPLAVAVFLLIVAVLTTPGFVEAFGRRSLFGFYVAATVAMWLCTLGPHPRLFDEPLLYRGPYAFLMLFPGFDDRLRVPARFATMMILTLSVAAGLALVRIRSAAPAAAGVVFTVLILGGIAADGWTTRIPVYAAPAVAIQPDEIQTVAAVLELPLGDLNRDIAAVYHSIAHGRPVVNGYSGFDPPHFRVLRIGLQRHDHSILTALSAFGPMAVAIDADGDPHGDWVRFVEAHEGTIRIARTPARTMFIVSGGTRAPEPDRTTLPIRQVSANGTPTALRAVIDGDPISRWTTGTPQRGHQEIVLELDGTFSTRGVSLSQGAYVDDFPRELAIATSVDGERWDEAWRGGTAGLALAAVLRDAHTPALWFAFPERPARFVRLRELQADATNWWSIADLAVAGSGPARPSQTPAVRH